MESRQRIYMRMLAALILMLSAAGCVTTAERRVISKGDPVAVLATCRLVSGELAASNEEEVATAQGVKVSPLYLPLKRFNPLALTAGVAPSSEPVMRSFEDDISLHIAKALPGMVSGERQTLEFKGAPVPGRVGDERFLKMARIRKRPRELRMSPEQFAARIGKQAEPGQSLVIDPASSGRVEEVTEKEVVVRFPVPDGTRAAAPFGSGTVKESGDSYEIEIATRPGDLVRTGPLAGKVIQVNDRVIVIDFGSEFAGETLQCNVKAELSDKVAQAGSEQ